MRDDLGRLDLGDNEGDSAAMLACFLAVFWFAVGVLVGAYFWGCA